MAAMVGAVGLSALDAVLHLAAGAALLAVVVGLALPREPGAPSPSRHWPAVALALLLAVGAVRAGNRLGALWLKSRPDAGLAGLEEALRWNPHDVEARLRLSEALVLERDCTRAAEHLQWLRGALPHHPSAQRLIQACARR
jgi:hypothetical protein